MGIARHYIKLGVEMVSCTTTLGTQAGPLLGPQIMREFLVPEYRRLSRSTASAAYSSTSIAAANRQPVLEPLMDLGVNILNPVQATANDLDKVRAATAGRMCLQGGVSSATIYDGPPGEDHPRGPHAAVAARARRRLLLRPRPGPALPGRALQGRRAGRGDLRPLSALVPEP